MPAARQLPGPRRRPEGTDEANSPTNSIPCTPRHRWATFRSLCWPPGRTWSTTRSGYRRSSKWLRPCLEYADRRHDRLIDRAARSQEDDQRQ